MIHYKKHESWIPFSHLEDTGVLIDHRLNMAHMIFKGVKVDLFEFYPQTTISSLLNRVDQWRSHYLETKTEHLTAVING